jgi:hypothetical protein
VVTGVGAVIALGLPVLLAAHPMHTSVTEVTQDASTRSVVVTLRVFADDFGTVAPDRVGPGAEAYVRAHFELTGPKGAPVALRWEGATLSGDVVQIRLSADVRGGLSGTRVRTTLLCERFSDQVNIVRATYGGRTTSLLFTRGDQAKALP